MTLQEYDKMMEEFREIEKKRQAFLFGELDKFLAKDPKDEARQVAHKISRFAIMYSTNGSSIAFVETKELVDKVHDILVNELMDYMLDDPEVYKDEVGIWTISAMFGGNYCLNWEG